MSAPKGNRYWELRSKHGRDTLFESPQLLWESACEYFTYIDDNPLQEEVVFHAQGIITHDTVSKKRPFTIMGLCLFLDCNKGYFDDFENSLKDKNDSLSNDFSVVITRIREIIYNQKFEGAVTGFFNANIIARELGLKESSQTENTNTNVVRILSVNPLTNENNDSTK